MTDLFHGNREVDLLEFILEGLDEPADQARPTCADNADRIGEVRHGARTLEPTLDVLERVRNQIAVVDLDRFFFAVLRTVDINPRLFYAGCS